MGDAGSMMLKFFIASSANDIAGERALMLSIAIAGFAGRVDTSDRRAVRLLVPSIRAGRAGHSSEGGH